MAGNPSQAVEHDAKTRGIILHIVEKIKREGVFDRFRRDCLEELDSKEPYRQLKQRVESHVASFLSKQTFSANLPKNQLRTSLRANINQSEVLSKGVDRLLEQVLVEKSSSFYKEIESLVEEHLIETGHYTRYDRDKSQKSDCLPRSEFTKLSDKEVEDIIKQETDRFLEASADERSQESDRSSMVETPPPGTSGEIIEVETALNTCNNAVVTPQVLTTNVIASIKPASEMISVEASASKASVAVEKTNALSLNISAKNTNETHTHKELENDKEISKPDQLTSANHNAEETDEISRPLAASKANLTRTSSTCESSQSIIIDAGLACSEHAPAQERIDEEHTGLKKSYECKKAGESTQGKGAPIPQEKIKERQDIREGRLEETVNTGTRMDERKTYKTENVGDCSLQIAPPETRQSNIDDTEMSKRMTYISEKIISRVGKAELDEPAVLMKDVDRQEVASSRVAKPEIATLQVSKSKDKSEQEACEKITKQTTRIEQKEVSKKLISMPNLFSTDEETDDDSGIPTARISGIISGNKPDKSDVKISELDIAELSDSDITVSSVHTSDLSSLEDSDMEYQDYQEQALKKSKEMKSAESGEDTQVVDDKSSETAGDEMVTRSDGCQDADETKKLDDESSEVSGDNESCKDEIEKNSDECDAESENIADEPDAGTSEKIDGGSGAVTSESIDSNEEPGVSSDASITAITDQESDRKDSNSDSVSDKNASSYKADDCSLGESNAMISESSPPERIEDASETTAEDIESTKAQVPASDEAVFKPIKLPQEMVSEESETVIAPGTDDTSDYVDDTEIRGSRKRRHSRRISTSQESESSNDTSTPTEEHKDAVPHRRSARVASKDKSRPDEKGDNRQGNSQKTEEAIDASRKLRRTRYSQEKTSELKAPRSKEEKQLEKAEKRTSRVASDSTDSDVKPSKRSKRTVKPTRCYSPSENS